MHEKGWKLTNITFPGFYHFEKCEPGKVTYRLDYNQEGVKNKTQYVQMFSDCGWDYLFDFVGYSYFCKKGDVIAVSHDYDGGEIFISIGQEEKTPVFYGNSRDGMGDFTVEIQEDGRYKIECSGRRARGVVKFTIS